MAKQVFCLVLTGFGGRNETNAAWLPGSLLTSMLPGRSCLCRYLLGSANVTLVCVAHIGTHVFSICLAHRDQASDRSYHAVF